MEEIIKMDDMQKLASSLVDYMRGDGGVAVAYIDGSFESESASERKRPLAILHTRNVVNRLKQELEDVFHRALDVSAYVGSEEAKFELSHIPTFAVRICDCSGYRGTLVVALSVESAVDYSRCLAKICDVVALYVESAVDYSRCLAKICDVVTESCVAENRKNHRLALGYYGIFGGFKVDGVKTIYFDNYDTTEVSYRIGN